MFENARDLPTRLLEKKKLARKLQKKRKKLTCLVRCAGFPNKNIGDAFLLVWRPTLNVGAVETAEMALRSFVRIIIEVDRSRVLRRWILSEKVQAPNPGIDMINSRYQKKVPRANDSVDRHSFLGTGIAL